MTERGARSSRCEPQAFTIGPSAVRFDGSSLIFSIDERASPWPSPIRGEVRLTTHSWMNKQYGLDGDGRHRWCPLAPMARVVVDLDSPTMQWSGDAYCDTNDGDEPLERGVHSWHWQRGTIDGDAVVFYDALDRHERRSAHALRFTPQGRVTNLEPPAMCRLSSSKWRVARAARSEGSASVVATLDDTPFYVRSLVKTQLLGQSVTCVHESLELNRFASPLVQFMLPFRMRRNA